LFTGYASGAIQSYLSGIAFTIYDFTGAHYFATGAYIYNNTYHYRWTGSVGVDYDDYVPVDSLNIDNQYGVDS
jgi:hypothetical protein